MNIILASKSPRRRELLAQMGLEFQIIVPDIDEDMGQELTPDQLVAAISADKAVAVAAQVGEDSLVIAADTVVVLDGEVLGKPHSTEEAKEMLSRLSGRSHRVYTGYTVRKGGKAISRSEGTDVNFRALTAEEIAAYVATGEPMDKAGAYGIQGRGLRFVQGIEGDFYTVMGLPGGRLVRALSNFVQNTNFL